MFFRQILHEDLGCASYVIADGGEAAVVDPKWEIGEYLVAAEEAGARIRYVVETHLHADHVSGRRRLGAVTGAAVLVPADPSRPDSAGLRDGHAVRVGRLELRALAAPGHRPEHMAYLVGDRAGSSDAPSRLLAGDSLLIGGIARPDLAVKAEDGARALWGTLRRLASLGDDVELWPGHVAGSLCASACASLDTSSTVGDERRTNPFLSLRDAGTLVTELIRSPPPRPPTVERVVALNRAGAAAPEALAELDAAALVQLLSDGGCVLDARAPEGFDSGHLTGALNFPARGKGIGTRAGWVAGADRRIAIVGPDGETIRRITSCLYAAGVWNLAGIAIADPAGWRACGIELSTARALPPDELVAALASGELRLIDVRDRAEWHTAHVPDSVHLPLSELGDGSALTLPSDQPLAVVCATGVRSALAASVMRRRGYRAVSRVTGGVAELAGYGAGLVGAAA